MFPFFILREGAPHGSGTINYDFIPDGKYNYSGSWKEGKRQGLGNIINYWKNIYVKSNIYLVSSFHFILGITWFRNDDIHQGYYENDKPHGNGQKKYVILTRQKKLDYLDYDNATSNWNCF